MDDFTASNGSRLRESMHPSAVPELSRYKGVRGWLLALCLMLTVVGPLITTWLMAYEYLASAPYFASFGGLQAAIFFSIAIKACVVVFGVYAGVRLWSIRPGAVDTAKYALVFGLVADALTTTLQTAFGPTSVADGQLYYEVTMRIIPSLIFFGICLAYLNKSTRVHVTYQSHG